MSNLTRFDPVEDLFRGFFVKPMQGPIFQDQSFKVDVTERDGVYVIYADLPGAKKEDIHVQIDGNLVTIGTEVKQEKEVKAGERVLRSERYYGKVSRSFQLGQEIDEAQATARFTDGVLELSLPKKKEGSRRRLMVQ